MEEKISSPEIKAISWGRIEIADRGVFKDVKLYPGGARGWDWNETGTNHSPGILPEDVAELVEAGATEIILTKGMQERLRVHPDTLAVLEEKRIRVHHLQTEAAAALYNRLRDKTAVAGLFHTTC